MHLIVGLNICIPSSFFPSNYNHCDCVVTDSNLTVSISLLFHFFKGKKSAPINPAIFIYTQFFYLIFVPTYVSLLYLSYFLISHSSCTYTIIRISQYKNDKLRNFGAA